MMDENVERKRMPGDKLNYFNCILCSKRTKTHERRGLSKAVKKVLRKNFLLDSFKESDVICNKCRHICRKNSCHRQVTAQRPQASQNEATTNPQFSPPSINLSIPSTSKSHSNCCICKKTGSKLVVISQLCRTHAFVNQNVMLPPGNRCCTVHLQDGVLTEDAAKQLRLTDSILVNRSYITEILQHMRELCLKNEKCRIDFDNPSSLTDSDYYTLVGIKKDNFNDLYVEVEAYLKNTPVRSIRMSLAVYLCKMKSGMSNQFLSTLFNISKSSIRRAISSVRNALLQTFVPSNIGFQHITREEVIRNHTRPLAQSLFGSLDNPKAIIVLDGTYIYIEKSNNFIFQRRSYSMHKGRPLLKPMVIVTTTGYFVAVNGPYLADAKNNDASILNHIIKNNVNDIRDWVDEDDTFIVDRGFRDALPVLEDLGINGEMPTFLKKGEKQMSTEDANLSRLVTKVRWVVEAANSRIKRWKYFGNILPTNQIPYIGDNIRIVCAICNKYFPPLSSGNAEEDDSLAAKMKHLSLQINSLQEYVERNSLERKSAKWEVAESLDDFPYIGENELRNMTCGTYQLKLCSNYIQEYVDGQSEILVFKEDRGLLRIKIQKMTEKEGRLNGSGDSELRPEGGQTLTDSTVISESTIIIEGPDISDDDGNYEYSDDFEDDEDEDESDGGEETDIEDNLNIEPQFTVCQHVSNPDLPETVTVLDTGWGSKVYLIGTAHFSVESQQDVSKVIQMVQPNVVMVELCNSRVNLLHLDEETLLEEAKNINMEKIRLSIQQSGLVQGIMHLLLLSMSAHLTKELGMAPGGEFRRAYNEAKQIPGCRLYLGDRPIQITLKRALSSLSLWQKLRLAWYLVTSKDPISKEEVEKCKQKDLLEQMLKEMTGEFPALSQVFVSERDIFLTNSLKNASLPIRSPEEPHELKSTTVVGVVGIGHVPGIIQNWPKESHDIREITSVPQGSLVGKLFIWSIRLSFLGLISYGCYRVYKWTFPFGLYFLTN